MPATREGQRDGWSRRRRRRREWKGDGGGGGSSWQCWRSYILKGNEKEFKGGDVGGWSSGNWSVAVMKKFKMVVMERKV